MKWVNQEITVNIDRNRFYIFDCNGKMIGNPFGYKTHSTAEAQTSRKGATVYSQIWHAYHKEKLVNPKSNLIYSIKAGGCIA
jgi:hypothetical protein